MLKDLYLTHQVLNEYVIALTYRGNISKFFTCVGTLSNDEDNAYEVSRENT